MVLVVANHRQWLYNTVDHATKSYGCSRRAPVLGSRHTADTVDVWIKAEETHRQRIIHEWAVDAVCLWFLVGVAHLADRVGDVALRAVGLFYRSCLIYGS